MELNEYQERAMETCTESCDNFSYMMLNLVGEVGELASKVAKAIRKEECMISTNDLSVSSEIYENESLNIAQDEALKLEAGDILWQLSGLCQVMGWKLEDVAQANLDKLQQRKANNTIIGDGDYR